MKVTNKIISRKVVVLSSALLGICTTIGFANPAQAAPRDDNARQYRQDDRDDPQAADNDNGGKHDAYQRPHGNRRSDDRKNGRDGGHERGHQDGNRRRRDDGYDFSKRGDKGSNRVGNRRPAPNRGSLNDRFEDNGGRSYTGTVTRVSSATSFDVNINGSTFNVYLDAPAPRGLSKGDSVRINGVQQDKNDIRNARVSLLRSR